MLIAQFPHCDTRVLHAPGQCKYCDRHPEWQELRAAWSIAYTGQDPVYDPEYPGRNQLPDPSEIGRRGRSAHDWPPNRPQGYRDPLA